MATSKRDGSTLVVQRTEEFVTALRATPSVQRFADTRRRFDTDPELQVLREEFRRLAAAFERAREAGQVDLVQVQEMREAQSRLQAHPIVREFMQAREAVGTLFQEVNRAISDTLGVDLGRTAGPAGGAC